MPRLCPQVTGCRENRSNRYPVHRVYRNSQPQRDVFGSVPLPIPLGHQWILCDIWRSNEERCVFFAFLDLSPMLAKPLPKWADSAAYIKLVTGATEAIYVIRSAIIDFADVVGFSFCGKLVLLHKTAGFT